MALAFLRKGKQPTVKSWVIFSPTIKVHDSQHEKGVQEGLLSSADNQRSQGAQTRWRSRTNTTTQPAIVVSVVVRSNHWCNRMYRPTAAQRALMRSLSTCAAGRREQHTLMGTGKRSNESCHYHPMPVSTIPPSPMMRASKGASQGSDETPDSPTTMRRRTMLHQVKGEEPAAGAVHPTACVVSRSSLEASHEPSSLLRLSRTSFVSFLKRRNLWSQSAHTLTKSLALRCPPSPQCHFPSPPPPLLSSKPANR